MRKLLSAFHLNYYVLHNYNKFLPVLHASDQINNSANNEEAIYHLSKIDTAFEFATLPVIVGVLLVSVLSLSFIFHLRFRYRLQEFNNLWTVRVLLVVFISHWAINEIIRLPLFRRTSIFPSLTLSEQDDLCKLHVVFSLGFLEPGFLITMLFIINESVKGRNHRSEIWSVLSVLLTSLPIFIIQIITVFLIPFKKHLGPTMIRTSFVTVDDDGNKSMTCTFPLLSIIIFGAFVMVYSVSLLVSCWRVVALVINRNTRLRISLLGFVVIISLLVQLFALGFESFLTPTSVWYGGALLGMFVSLAMGATLAEFVLVIKPILEAFVADGDNCDWNLVVRYLHLVEDPNL